MGVLGNGHRRGAWGVLACLAAVLQIEPSVAAEPRTAPADCRPEQGLTYICGLIQPEDLVSVGSTGQVLASGHRVPGHLYLVDPAANTVRELLQDAAFRQQHDTNLYPGCPGPLNTRQVDVHGLSIAETAPGRFVVYTTSHGEREAIEIYTLDMTGAVPVLTWTGCVPLQQDGYFNGVVRLRDGGFVATRMRDANVPTSAVAPGAISGRLFEWHPGGALQPLARTELSLPNGIEASPDGRYLYVAASGTQELVRFDRSVTPWRQRTMSLPFGPDNLHWDDNGKLIVAGPNSGPACTGSNCPAGWTVIEVDPDTFAFSVLRRVDGRVAIQRVSAAIRVGREIWIGSNQDRIARFVPE